MTTVKKIIASIFNLFRFSNSCAWLFFYLCTCKLANLTIKTIKCFQASILQNFGINQVETWKEFPGRESWVSAWTILSSEEFTKLYSKSQSEIIRLLSYGWCDDMSELYPDLSNLQVRLNRLFELFGISNNIVAIQDEIQILNPWSSQFSTGHLNHSRLFYVFHRNNLQNTSCILYERLSMLEALFYCLLLCYPSSYRVQSIS